MIGYEQLDCMLKNEYQYNDPGAINEEKGGNDRIYNNTNYMDTPHAWILARNNLPLDQGSSLPFQGEFYQDNQGIFNPYNFNLNSLLSS